MQKIDPEMVFEGQNVNKMEQTSRSAIYFIKYPSLCLHRMKMCWNCCRSFFFFGEALYWPTNRKHYYSPVPDGSWNMQVPTFDVSLRILRQYTATDWSRVLRQSPWPFAVKEGRNECLCLQELPGLPYFKKEML